MTDPRETDDLTTPDDGQNLPEGVTEEFREISDDDLAAVGTNQTTLGEGGTDLDDLDDDLDEDTAGG